MRSRLLLSLALVAAACSGTADSTGTTSETSIATAEPAGPVREPNWIAIDSDGFTDRRTGETFVPRGINLIRKRQPMFASYDPDWVDDQLDEIVSMGFNTVRFFFDLCKRCPSNDDGLTPQFLDQLTDVLHKIADRGMVALPAPIDIPDPGFMANVPCCDTFGGGRNSLYLTQEGHEISQEFFTQVIEGVTERGAPLHAVLAWELVNEHYMSRSVAPLSLTEGLVSTVDGGTYDMSDNNAVEQMYAGNLVLWINNVAEAVRQADPGGYVTMGFFPADDPQSGRIGPNELWSMPRPAIYESSLDFVDLHAYPGGGHKWEDVAALFGLDMEPPVPIILGEFGAFLGVYADPMAGAAGMARWQVQSCEVGFQGWLLWLWGDDVDDESHTADVDDATIARAVSPNLRPDPCAVGPFLNLNLALDKPATASAEESEEFAAKWATDGSIGTSWSAAAGPPQWIEIDLEETTAVQRFEIVLGGASEPAAQRHRIYVRDAQEPAPGRLVGEISTTARNEDRLVLELDEAVSGVRYARIETLQWDSWVIFNEVEVYGPT